MLILRLSSHKPLMLMFMLMSVSVSLVSEDRALMKIAIYLGFALTADCQQFP